MEDQVLCDKLSVTGAASHSQDGKVGEAEKQQWYHNRCKLKTGLNLGALLPRSSAARRLEQDEREREKGDREEELLVD